MNKILLCEDCGDGAKFTGSRKNNGYGRKKTTYYYKYHCRACGRSYHRDEVHKRINAALSQIVYEGDQHDEFMEALETVWREKQSDKLKQRAAVQLRLDKMNTQKSLLVREMAQTEDAYKQDIREEIDSSKNQISVLQQQLDELNNPDEDLVEFLNFAFSYTETLSSDWWELSYEDRVRGQLLLFPGGIFFNSQKKIGTTNLSSIYRLKTKKKDSWKVQKSHMVELAGTAPASIRLAS